MIDQDSKELKRRSLPRELYMASDIQDNGGVMEGERTFYYVRSLWRTP